MMIIAPLVSTSDQKCATSARLLWKQLHNLKYSTIILIVLYDGNSMQSFVTDKGRCVTDCRSSLISNVFYESHHRQLIQITANLKNIVNSTYRADSSSLQWSTCKSCSETKNKLHTECRVQTKYFSYLLEYKYIPLATLRISFVHKCSSKQNRLLYCSYMPLPHSHRRSFS